MKKAFVYFLWAILLMAAGLIIIIFMGSALLIHYIGAMTFIKSTWKSLLVLTIVLVLIKIFLMRRVNNLFIYRFFSHDIGQMPSILALIQLNFRNNYKGNKPNRRMGKFICKSSKKARKFFENTRIKEFTTETNDIMADQLKVLEKKGIIKLIETEKPETILNKIKDKISKKDNTQSMEKLLLFGLVTTLRNCMNKDYWDFINRPESVKYYKIIVLKE